MRWRRMGARCRLNVSMKAMERYAAINKDRERVLRTGEPSCRTRIVERVARAGARSLPLVPPQCAPLPPFVRYHYPMAFLSSGAASRDT
jgi:hypothetical protein